MIKRRGFSLILLSLLLALGAAWIARNWLHARLNGGAPPDPGVTVVVAAMEIPFATKIEPRHVKLITLPRNAQVGDHFEKADEVVGLIATQKQVSGEILLKEQFADRTGGSTLAALLKADMRAVTVRVDDVVGVGGFLLPGNHVDVVASRLINSTQRAEAQTVLQNLNVLAVDQTASQDKDQPVVVRAVTLEVTPKQAEVLVRAREEGKIQLTLRNPLEDHAAVPEVLVADSAPPPPAPPPKVIIKKVKDEAPRPSGNSVVIIRGTNIQTTGSSS
jgi:pilus assembly protein CpaB